MTKLLRALSLVLFLGALASVATLLLADGSAALHLSPLHQRAGAFALILIGASYICLLLGSPQRHADRWKGLFLGLAFVLWGSEQFLPASRWVTLIDSAVIVIFVVDLGLIIITRLRPDRAAGS